MKLHIAKNLSLPLDTVTQAVGILAKRRAGKSYTARRFAEQLFNGGQQIVIVDPKGDWWGIRSSSDGKSPGLPVVILGGERGDVPLEVNAGEVVAKLVVEERVSVLLDLSLLRKHEVSTFMGMFLETLYRLKAREQFRTPVMLIVDEADAIAPQKPYKGEERMLGAAEDIVRRGGQRGIGCTLITQRSAVLNKNVLTQIQILVALRTIAPQDLAAIDAWIDVHGTEEERQLLKQSLPSLPIGDAWLWSPGWPTSDGIFERVHVLPIETFDSGATPKPGEKRVEPKNLADVDLDALSRQMSATIEKAKAENPKELQKKVRELEVQLKKLETAKPATAAPAETKTVEKRVVIEASLTRLEKLVERAEKLEEQLRDTSTAITGESATIAGMLFDARKLNEPFQQAQRPTPRQIQTRDLPPARNTVQRVSRQLDRDSRELHAGSARDLKITPKQQQILDAIAWYESIGNQRPSGIQVGAIALIDSTGGHFSNTVGPLTSSGLIERGGGQIWLTDAGRAVANVPEDIGTLDDYHEVLRRRVRKAKSASGRTIDVLDVIIAANGSEVSTKDIGESLSPPIDHTGGHFSNTIGPLSTLGLIERSQGMVRPTEVLFPPGLS